MPLTFFAAVFMLDAVRPHNWPKESQLLDLHCQSSASGVVSASSFMCFSHYSCDFFPGEIVEQYLLCALSEKAIFQEDVRYVAGF